jgi:hypothetical protein
MRSRIFLAASVFVVVACLCVAGADQSNKQVPFKGSIQGNETHTIQTFPEITANGSCTGIGTLVGQLSFTYQDTINIVAGTGTGIGQLIAANGDSIYTTIIGSSEPTGTPGVRSITEIDTITGGTGRFAGAQGSFVVERLINQTDFTSGSFHGTITSPGA